MENEYACHACGKKDLERSQVTPVFDIPGVEVAILCLYPCAQDYFYDKLTKEVKREEAKRLS